MCHICCLDATSSSVQASSSKNKGRLPLTWKKSAAAKTAFVDSFKAHIRAIYRCPTELLMRLRWRFAKADLAAQHPGCEDFCAWFEQSHFHIRWVKWTYRASGVPGLLPNTGMVESWWNFLKSSELTETDREQPAKFHLTSVPQIIKLSTIKSTGITLDVDLETCELPRGIVVKALALARSATDVWSAGGVAGLRTCEDGRCWYFNTSRTMGTSIRQSRATRTDIALDIVQKEGYPRLPTSSRQVDVLVRNLHRVSWRSFQSRILGCSCLGYWHTRICAHRLAVMALLGLLRRQGAVE